MTRPQARPGRIIAEHGTSTITPGYRSASHNRSFATFPVESQPCSTSPDAVTTTSAHNHEISGQRGGRIYTRRVRVKACLTCGGEYRCDSDHGGKQWAGRKFCSPGCVRKSPRPLRVSIYRRVSAAPGTKRCTYAHRAIMEKILGRPLLRREHVHHINGDKRDNRPENLAVIDAGEHSRLHHAGKPKSKRHGAATA